jgi:hypothetical protein
MVSVLSDSGARLEDVADVAGHSSTRVTAEVYRRRITPSVSVARTVMDEVFAEVSNAG